jgi:hypothetical protein
VPFTPTTSESNESAPPVPPAAGKEANRPASEAEVSGSPRPTAYPATGTDPGDRSAQSTSSSLGSDRVDDPIVFDRAALEVEIDRLRQELASLKKERDSFGVLFAELGVSSVEAALHAARELKSHAA